MSDQEGKARKAILLICQMTTLQQQAFRYDAFVQGIGGVDSLPETVQNVRFQNQAEFVAALEKEAEVTSLRELQGTARLAPTPAQFEVSMQGLFSRGELPVEWALRFKQAKQRPDTLQQLQDFLRNLDLG